MKVTPEELLQARISYGLEQFEKVQKLFPEAFQQLVYTFFKTGVQNPKAFQVSLDHVLEDPEISEADKFTFVSLMQTWAQEKRLEILKGGQDKNV